MATVTESMRRPIDNDPGVRCDRVSSIGRRLARPVTAMTRPRRLHVGAETIAAGVNFRVWAPRAHGVEVVLERERGAGHTATLTAEAGGYFAADVP